MLGIFGKLDVIMDLSNVEDYHWIKSSKVPKRVIVKLSRGTLIKYVDQKKV